MRTCEDYIDLISARLDGLLTHEEEQELEAHLADCPDCRALADQMAEIHAAFSDFEEIPAPEGFAKGVMGRIESLAEPKKTVVPLFSRPQIRALAGLAACAVLCAGIYQSGLWNRWKTGGAVKDMATASAGIESETSSTNRTDISAGSSSVPEQKMSISSLPAPEVGAGENSSDQTEPSQSAAAAAGGVGGEKDSGADSAAGSSSSAEEDVLISFALAPQTGAAASAASYEVAGQTVNAILTLPQLPEGGQEVLGADTQWLADEQGRACCFITRDQMDALMALAEAQGQDLTDALTNQMDADGLCALVLEH